MNSQVRKIFVPLGRRSVVLCVPLEGEESPDGRILFWWSVTGAAVALAQHLDAMEDPSGHRVLELGCGMGLPGITAGLHGAEVLLTDYVPRSLDFAGRNARMNGLSEDRVRCLPLDWENPGDLTPFDIVVGAEIVYDYFHHGSLVRLLEQAVKPGGVLLLADRKRLAVSRFIGRMINRGFECSESLRRVELPGFPEQEISIFRLRSCKPVRPVRDAADL
jgi:predicted nicotinamide N-methyase